MYVDIENEKDVDVDDCRINCHGGMRCIPVRERQRVEQKLEDKEKRRAIMCLPT